MINDNNILMISMFKIILASKPFWWWRTTDDIGKLQIILISFDRCIYLNRCKTTSNWIILKSHYVDAIHPIFMTPGIDIFNSYFRSENILDSVTINILIDSTYIIIDSQSIILIYVFD